VFNSCSKLPIEGVGSEAAGIAELAVMIAVSLVLVGSAAGAAIARKAWRALSSR
jgi:hypothetical protein